MQEAAITAQDTTLPLPVRIKRALIIALLLGVWAPFKIAWEQKISAEQNLLRYSGVQVTTGLREQLSQGMVVAVLAGGRNIVADGLWLMTIPAWMNQDWPEMDAVVSACTTLQPRAPMFWDMGGWQIGWNASIFSGSDVVRQPNPLRRLKAERYWADRGRDILLRGLQYNPTYWRLWNSTALLFDQRLHDWKTAAYYYERASEMPNAPIYLERFPAHMYDAKHLNDPAQEYAEWVKLWKKLTPEQRKQPMHLGNLIEGEIRTLENKLNVPNEKRIFPK